MCLLLGDYLEVSKKTPTFVDVHSILPQKWLFDGRGRCEIRQ